MHEKFINATTYSDGRVFKKSIRVFDVIHRGTGHTKKASQAQKHHHNQVHIEFLDLLDIESASPHQSHPPSSIISHGFDLMTDIAEAIIVSSGYPNDACHS